jgi:hypothetical protein
MHSFVSSMLGDVSPGLVLALVALLAAVPPYLALCQSSRGRARSAVGYLLGLFSGLVATVVAAVALRDHADPEAVVAAGLTASFFSPFVGMVRAKWQRKKRPIRRRTFVEGT